MAFWDVVDRTLKIVGIIGGLAAAAAVIVQLRDLSNKAQQQDVQDWQDYAVSKIIQDKKGPIDLAELLPKYAAEANGFYAEIPKSVLDMPHLRMALLRLVKNQAVVDLGDGSYTARQMPRDFGASSAKAMADSRRLQLVTIQAARRVLLENHNALTAPQFSQLIIMQGGDRKYLEENLESVEEQLLYQGNLVFLADGRVQAGSGMPGRPVLDLTPPPDIAKLLSKLDGQAVGTIMTVYSPYDYCLASKSDYDFSDGRMIATLAELKVIDVEEKRSTKDMNGHSCAIVEHVIPSAMLFRLKEYLYTVVLTSAQMFRSDPH